MTKEIASWLEKNTWYLVHPTFDININCNKLIFWIKQKVDNHIERYKAQLVAKVFHQTLKIDFNENSSPVAKVAIIKLILNIVVMNN